MFMKDGRLVAVRHMILAERGSEEEAEALSDLEEGHREDFEQLLRAMSGHPVAVRLLDPPLHEFLPNSEDLRGRFAASEAGEEAEELQRILKTVEALEETNPMFGTRGVRLGLLRLEVYRMQARAVVAAAAPSEVRATGPSSRYWCLSPSFPRKLKRIKKILRDELEDEDIPIGATVKAPRACVAAHTLRARFPSFPSVPMPSPRAPSASAATMPRAASWRSTSRRAY